MAAPSGTVTFLFSDIEGSTARWEAHREAMQAALARHDRLMRVIFERHGGHVFKTVGDEFCVAFARPPDAVAAAIDAQRAIAGEDWRAVDGLRVRMAIHTGVADERDGDYFGPTVNRVARLLAAGHGEQVLVSQVTADLLAGHPSASLLDLGIHRLKDVPNPEAIFQVVAPDLREAFPPLRAIEANPTNVPLQLTSFVGRNEEVAEIESLLAESRLVTLTGSGGVGKTRTALRIARETLSSYPDGTWFADLAPLNDPDLVPAVLASALRVQTGARSVSDDLVLALKDRCLLVVLDNCEHVVESAATLAQRVLQGCPDVRIMATSREALGIAGERTYRMPSLRDDVALELFTDRARSVQPKFELTAANEAVAREIVRRLDGIALAIELAASRLKIVSLDRIAAGLDERFKLLTGGARAALPRQQTLRALIAWSYDLLSEAERGMLRQLAVFRGAWTLEAAADVCAGERAPDWDPLALLESLVEKSLVVVEPSDRDMRYRLLESTREYALERSRERLEAEASARRHAAYYQRIARRLFDDYWKINLDDWNERVRSDAGNFLGAIEWGLLDGNEPETGASILACVDWIYPDLSGPLAFASRYADRISRLTTGLLRLAQARRYLQAAIAQPAAEALAIFEERNDPVFVAEALLHLALARFRDGDVSGATAYTRRAIEIVRTLDLPRFEAGLLGNLSVYVAVGGDPAAGRAFGERAVAIYSRFGDDMRIASPLGNLAEMHFAAGEPREALACARRTLDIASRCSSATQMTLCHHNIAAYLLALGDPAGAWANARAALEIERQRSLRLGAAISIGHLAHVAAIEGDAERAARLVGYADAVYRTQGTKREFTEQCGYDATMEILGGVLGRERLQASIDEGARLTEDEAVREALGVAEPVTSPSESAL